MFKSREILHVACKYTDVCGIPNENPRRRSFGNCGDCFGGEKCVLRDRKRKYIASYVDLNHSRTYLSYRFVPRFI